MRGVRSRQDRLDPHFPKDFIIALTCKGQSQLTLHLSAQLPSLVITLGLP